MSGTLQGGKAAAATNKAKYGADFYAKIGAKGGKLGRTGGFFGKAECNCDEIEEAHTKPQCAGKRGGRNSRRTKKVVDTAQAL